MVPHRTSKRTKKTLNVDAHTDKLKPENSHKGHEEVYGILTTYEFGSFPIVALAPVANEGDRHSASVPIPSSVPINLRSPNWPYVHV